MKNPPYNERTGWLWAIRRELAALILPLLIWMAKHHRPFETATGTVRCVMCNEVWPCRRRRETDERAGRLT